MAWCLIVERGARKELHALPIQARDRVIAALARLADDPFAMPGVKALVGRADYRLRVGDYRLIYDLDRETQTITVETVAQRGGVYR